MGGRRVTTRHSQGLPVSVSGPVDPGDQIYVRVRAHSSQVGSRGRKEGGTGSGEVETRPADVTGGAPRGNGTLSGDESGVSGVSHGLPWAPVLTANLSGSVSPSACPVGRGRR